MAVALLVSNQDPWMLRRMQQTADRRWPDLPRHALNIDRVHDLEAECKGFAAALEAALIPDGKTLIEAYFKGVGCEIIKFAPTPANIRERGRGDNGAQPPPQPCPILARRIADAPYNTVLDMLDNPELGDLLRHPHMNALVRESADPEHIGPLLESVCDPLQALNNAPP